MVIAIGKINAYAIVVVAARLVRAMVNALQIVALADALDVRTTITIAQPVAHAPIPHITQTIHQAIALAAWAQGTGALAEKLLEAPAAETTTERAGEQKQAAQTHPQDIMTASQPAALTALTAHTMTRAQPTQAHQHQPYPTKPTAHQEHGTEEMQVQQHAIP